MTDWLVRTFVPDPDDTQSPQARNRYGRLSSVVCILCNVLLCLAKGLVGLAAGSLSVVADAVNNLTDASSNVVSLAGFRLASRPADQGHPYGHGRYEYLAGMMVALIIVVVGFELGRSSVERIVSPQPVDFGWATVAALLLSMAVKLWMARFNHALAQRIGSVTLEATAQDSRNDVIATASVLTAGVISATTGLDLDGWMGLAVAAFIVASGVGLLRDTVDPLLGITPSAELVRRLHDRILSYPGVLGTHDLLVHDYGPGRKFASAHVEMAADTTVRESHRILDQIEDDILREENLSIVLHCDPVETHAGEANLANWLGEQVASIDPRLSVHDVEVEGEHGRRVVRLDCVRPEGLEMTDDELVGHITDAVRMRMPGATCQVTLDSGFVSPVR